MAARKKLDIARFESPSGLTIELAKKLIEDRKTMPRRWVATTNGISPKTFQRWIQIGCTTDDPTHVFLARGIFEVEGTDVSESMSDLKMLRKASPAATDLYLKFMHPADFGGPMRQGPDEFEEQERNSKAQDKLLSSPPPRMMSKMQEHGWVQIPSGATQEERERVLDIIRSVRDRLSCLPRGDNESE